MKEDLVIKSFIRECLFDGEFMFESGVNYSLECCELIRGEKGSLEVIFNMWKEHFVIYVGGNGTSCVFGLEGLSNDCNIIFNLFPAWF